MLFAKNNFPSSKKNQMQWKRFTTIVYFISVPEGEVKLEFSNDHYPFRVRTVRP
jgi:hypothetical protein